MTTPVRASRLVPRCLAGLAAMSAGAAIFAVAVPIAVADLAALPGDPVLERLREEATVDGSELERFARSREVALRWRETASGYAELALGRLILEKFPNGGRRADPMRTESLTAHGLGLAPMDPYGWMRLAQARLDRGAPAPEIAAPLQLALRSGPHEDRRHAMLLLMVEVGLLVWDRLDDDERALIGEKARWAWLRDVRRTAAAAERTGRTDVLADLLGF